MLLMCGAGTDTMNTLADNLCGPIHVVIAIMDDSME